MGQVVEGGHDVACKRSHRGSLDNPSLYVAGGRIMVIRTGTWEDAQAPVPRDADIIMFACANSRLSVRGTVCREA